MHIVMHAPAMQALRCIIICFLCMPVTPTAANPTAAAAANWHGNRPRMLKVDKLPGGSIDPYSGEWKAHSITTEFVQQFIRNSKAVMGNAFSDQSPYLRTIVTFRNSVLTNSARELVIQNGYTAQTVIYIWLHTKYTHKTYVGHTEQSLTVRTKGHLESANARMHSKVPLHQQGTVEGLDMYKFMCEHGLKGLFVIPLEVLRDGTPIDTIVGTEQRWINMMNSKWDGYNAIAAQKVTADQFGPRLCARRWYASRDVLRRVTHAVRSMNSYNGRPAQLTAATFAEFFAQYGKKTLQSMHNCSLNADSRAALCSETQGYQLHVDKVDQLMLWLEQVLSERITPGYSKRKQRDPMIFVYAPIMDMVLSSSVLNHPSLANMLPPGVSSRPVIAFKYIQQQGSKFRIHAQVARMPSERMDSIVNSPCLCDQPAFTEFCKRGHVSSCDAKVLVNAPSGLQDLWTLGAKHRPLQPQEDSTGQHAHGNDSNNGAVAAANSAGLFVFRAPGGSSGRHRGQRSQTIQVSDRGIFRNLGLATVGDGMVFNSAVRDEIAVELSRGISVYATELARKHDCWVPTQQWAQRLTDLFIERLESLQFGKDISPASKPHGPGVNFIRWDSSFDAYLKVYHRRFVINIADKVSNNMNVECIKQYIIKNRNDLDNGGYYVRQSGPLAIEDALHAMREIMCNKQLCRTMLTAQQAAYLDKVSENYQQRVAAQASGTALPALYESTVPPRQRDYKEAVPVAGSMTKIHKEGDRFLHLCCDISLSAPAKWMTALYRSLEANYAELWYGSVMHVLRYNCHVNMWLAKNNGKALEVLRHFNLSGTSPSEFAEGGGFKALDFERMYSNMNLQDTIDKHGLLFDELWRIARLHKGWIDHADKPGILQVFKAKSVPAVWHANMREATRAYPSFGGDNNEDWGMHSMPDKDAINPLQHDRWGVDQKLGQFYLFDVQHAKEMLSALLSTSFVRFGSDVWRQTVGIPMGINPAVYVANYYLFYYELQCVKPIVEFIRLNPPVGLPGDPLVRRIAERLLEADVTQQELQQHRIYHGNAALLLLRSFRFMFRFVDDLGSPPNPYLDRLLHVNQSIMGGLFKGIYPTGLHIPAQPVLENGYRLQYMDIEMVFEDVLLSNGTIVVQGVSKLFDKREGEAYAGINIAQYTHVTSQLSVSCGYNILTSQALRFGSIISDRADFIKRCCMLLTKMVAQGYEFTLLKRKLKAFLQRHKITVDNNAPNRLFNDIMGAYEQASC